METIENQTQLNDWSVQDICYKCATKELKAAYGYFIVLYDAFLYDDI